MLQTGHSYDRFVILRLLGQGATADVYLAKEPGRKMPVALRLIKEEASPEIHQAELRGARLQQILASEIPEIPGIYDSGELQGRTFVSMEAIPGVELSRLLAHSPMSEFQALSLASDILKILDRAHSLKTTLDGHAVHGVAHCDLKPENILIHRKQVRLLDFGTAKALFEKAPTEAIRRMTPHYLPPEAHRSLEVSTRVDLWAVGVILYQMVCGQLPFLGIEDREVSQHILNGAPISPPSDLSTPMRRLLERILHAEAQQRPENAREIIRLLEQTNREMGGEEFVDYSHRWVSNEELYGGWQENWAPGPSGLSTKYSESGGPPADAWKPSESVSYEPPKRDIPSKPSETGGVAKKKPMGYLALKPVILIFLVAFVAWNFIVFFYANQLSKEVLRLDREPLAAWKVYGTLKGFCWERAALVSFRSALEKVLAERAQASAGDFYLPWNGTAENSARWSKTCEYLEALASLNRNQQTLAQIRYCRTADLYLSQTKDEDLTIFSPPPEEIDEIRQGFQEAVLTDPEWAQPHMALAQVFILLDFDFEQSLSHLEKAEALGQARNKEHQLLRGIAFGKECDVVYGNSQRVRGTSQERVSLSHSRSLCQEALDLLNISSNHHPITRRIVRRAQLHQRGIYNRLTILGESS